MISNAALPKALQLLAWFTISEKMGPIFGLVTQFGLIPIKLWLSCVLSMVLIHDCFQKHLRQL